MHGIKLEIRPPHVVPVCQVSIVCWVPSKATRPEFFSLEVRLRNYKTGKNYIPKPANKHPSRYKLHPGTKHRYDAYDSRVQAPIEMKTSTLLSALLPTALALPLAVPGKH
jgi:hypothetical protein